MADRFVTHRELQQWKQTRRTVLDQRREIANFRLEQNRQAAVIENFGPMLENMAQRAAEAAVARALRMGLNRGPQQVPQPFPQHFPQPFPQHAPQPFPQHAPQPIPQRAAVQPIPQAAVQPNIQPPARDRFPEENKKAKAQPAIGNNKQIKKRRQRDNVRGALGRDQFVIGSTRQQRDTTYQPEDPIDVHNLTQRKNPGRSSRLSGRSYFPTPTPIPEG
ncbi:hypothetical protein KCU95_g18461, partial [Aureobasidium melanogenum]